MVKLVLLFGWELEFRCSSDGLSIKEAYKIRPQRLWGGPLLATAPTSTSSSMGKQSSWGSGIVGAFLTGKQFWSEGKDNYSSKFVVMQTGLEGKRMLVRGGCTNTCLHLLLAFRVSLRNSCVKFSTIFPTTCSCNARCISATLFGKHCISLLWSLPLEDKLSRRIAQSWICTTPWACQIVPGIGPSQHPFFLRHSL